MRGIIAIILAVALGGCATLAPDHANRTNSSWRLVYAHDAAGIALEGSKAELIDAVQNGKPVRIYTPGRTVQHSADALFLTIFEGEVFAQVHPIESQQPMSNPPRILFRQPGQKWRMIVGTNGSVTALMDGNAANERSGAARWFVED